MRDMPPQRLRADMTDAAQIAFNEIFSRIYWRASAALITRMPLPEIISAT